MNRRRIAFATNSQSACEWTLSVVCWMAAAMVASLFFLIVGDIVWKGLSGLRFDFLFSSPQDFGREGGILPIWISTFWILVVALVVALPLSLSTAVFLSEFTRRQGWGANLVRRSLDVLAATPSIVFGLFGNALFCQLLGMGYSILAGGLTLACMILPILIRALELSLRNVPDDLRMAAESLGVSKIRTIRSVLLPQALPGLLVGLILGIGRVLAETAALLFTSGYVDRMPRNLLDSGRSLSIHIYDLSMHVGGGEPNAYRTAFVLVTLLVSINLVLTWILKKWIPHQL